jgi:adenosyl cobinamide kinase/adenosyl cobinamide phosphate guanylyltransferase
MAIVLLLGGARSGKSAMAMRMALHSGAPVTFIATAQPGDDEMAERIERHRDDRPASWKTLEAPVDVLGAVCTSDADNFLVLDCLTLWVSNLLGEGSSPDQIEATACDVIAALQDRSCVVVTNEVGLGIVPANELARTFRDVLGAVNSLFAAAADRSVLMVAGRALDLSSNESALGPL